MWVVRLLLVAAVVAALAWLLARVPFAWPSYAFYTAAILALAATAGCIRPVRTLFLPARTRAAAVLAVSLTLAAVALLWPATRQQQADPGVLLHRLLPVFDHVEYHAVTVPVPAAAAWSAVGEVRFEDVPALDVLMRMRQAAVGELSPDLPVRDRPILSALLAPESGFFPIVEEPGREIVLGMIGRPWADDVRREGVRGEAAFLAYAEPGDVKIAFNFRVTDEGAAVRISTETRIVGIDEAASRAFTRYWRVVYPGSAITRHAWLDAIARRARREQRD
jgi:hypothetical protein